MRNSTLGPYRGLVKVFGKDSDAVLPMAAQGATRQEISDQLGVSEKLVQRFTDQFVDSPEGFFRMLLRDPTLLSKVSQTRSMIRAAIKDGRR